MPDTHEPLQRTVLSSSSMVVFLLTSCMFSIVITSQKVDFEYINSLLIYKSLAKCINIGMHQMTLS